MRELKHRRTPYLRKFRGSWVSWKVSCLREHDHSLDKEEDQLESHFHKEGISLY